MEGLQKCNTASMFYFQSYLKKMQCIGFLFKTRISLPLICTATAPLHCQAELQLHFVFQCCQIQQVHLATWEISLPHHHGLKTSAAVMLGCRGGMKFIRRWLPHNSLCRREKSWRQRFETWKTQNKKDTERFIFPWAYFRSLAHQW